MSHARATLIFASASVATIGQPPAAKKLPTGIYLSVRSGVPGHTNPQSLCPRRSVPPARRRVGATYWLGTIGCTPQPHPKAGGTCMQMGAALTPKRHPHPNHLNHARAERRVYQLCRNCMGACIYGRIAGEMRKPENKMLQRMRASKRATRTRDVREKYSYQRERRRDRDEAVLQDKAANEERRDRADQRL